MNTALLSVTTPSGSYPIIVEPGALGQLAQHLQAVGLHGTVWLIADQAVYKPHAEALLAQLNTAGYRVHSITVPSGEPSKDMPNVMRLFDWLIAGGVERRDTILALGGGVVGDLAGFVAATALRGIHFVQLPTTLLAMVDSSVGGKTGINHVLGKNLIGAFYQPRLVLADVSTLATLPSRELHAGWAEAIKHGVISDPGLFEQLEQEAGHALQRSEAAMAALIRRAVKVKVDIVNRDERETGERMLLNYGHTLGHAVEAAAGYGQLLHGEAVAIGMHLEAQIAQALNMISAEILERQRVLLEAYQLPTHIPAGMHLEAVEELMLRDKKVRAGKVRWALPTGIGSATIRDDIAPDLVRTILFAQR